MFKRISRSELGRDDWDAFVERSDEAWLWHRFAAIDVIAGRAGRTDRSFAIWDDGAGALAGLVPLHRVASKAFGVFSLNTLSSMGGLALSAELGKSHRRKVLAWTHEELLDVAVRERAYSLNMTLSPMAPALRGTRTPLVNPLIELGLENQPAQAWVVDVSRAGEALWDGLEKRARTAVRKAESLGVEVRPADQPGDVDIYFSLHQQTYGRTGAATQPRAYFEGIWELMTSDQARVFFALKDGEVIAAESFGVDKQAAVYWTGASSAAGLETNANSLLQWKAIEWMQAQGIEWYETGQAFPGLSGGKRKQLSDFKRSFGGKLHPIYKGRLPVSRLARLSSALLRRGL